MPIARSKRTVHDKRDHAQRLFAQLHAQLEPAVRRFIRRLIGVTTQEDDIVQDAFLALYRNLNRVDPTMLRPYLFRIVRNLCYDELRRQGRFRLGTVSLDANSAGVEVPAAPVESALGNPERNLEQVFAYTALAQAMAHLPEPQRQAVILYYYEDFTYAQIAEATRTPVNTVKARLHHARKNLRRHLRRDTEEMPNMRQKGGHTD